MAGSFHRAYPTPGSFIVRGNLSASFPNTPRWDYIRYGVPKGEPNVPRERIRRLGVKCRDGRITATVRSRLPEGTQLTITNSGVRKAPRIKPNGRGEITYKQKTGQHTIPLLDRPAASKLIECE